ncbi:7595_t:CDS:1, partial [Paraglomus occultum]
MATKMSGNFSQESSLPSSEDFNGTWSQQGSKTEGLYVCDWPIVWAATAIVQRNSSDGDWEIPML